jgi:hypothetical protein
MMILWQIHRWHEVRWQPQPPLTLSWGNPPRSQGNLPHKGQQPQEEEGDDRQGGHQRAEDLIHLDHFGKRGSVGYQDGQAGGAP